MRLKNGDASLKRFAAPGHSSVEAAAPGKLQPAIPEGSTASFARVLAPAPGRDLRREAAHFFGVPAGARGVKAERRAIRYIGSVKALAIVLTALALVAAAEDVPLIQPQDLVPRLGTFSAPPVFYVGPNVLYRSKHIRGSIFAGPGARPEGIALLKAAAAKIPKDREIVIYCGCCPWDHCPNIKPAMDELKKMGYTKAKALYLPLSFKSGWIDKNYPVE